MGEVIYNRRGRPLTSDELRQQLPGCDGLNSGLDRIDHAALESADCMGWQSLRDCISVLRGEAPLYPVLTQGASA